MTSDLDFLHRLERVIAERRQVPAGKSYTASLLAAGPRRIAQKVGEEGVELALAGAGDSRESVVSEAADLLYHMLVLLAAREVPLSEVVGELERRHRDR